MSLIVPRRHNENMDVGFILPLAPMLAAPVSTVPTGEGVPGGLLYEPKWDGFRCIVLRDGDEVELASRGKKSLTRYFPEVVAEIRARLPARCALDTELVVRRGTPGRQRLDWESLSQRIHPAGSRIARLSQETPAEVIAFDLLSQDGVSLLDRPFAERRAALERMFTAQGDTGGVHLTRTTRDPAVAQEWFTRFEGAGLDGVVAKPLDAAYAPGRRTLFKVKHRRTAEAVLLGYRRHTSGVGVGSLLLGLYDQDGVLRPVGGITSFTQARRTELWEQFSPLALLDAEGRPVHATTGGSRFSSGKDNSYIPLPPEYVVEVAFDQLEGARFRHAVSFLRWRPDREPTSCTLAQIERAPAYDLGQVLDPD